MSADTRRAGRLRGHPMVVSLRHRDFRFLWMGMAASLVGDGVFLVALAWQVYTLSSAPYALALIGLSISLPHVALLLFGGALSDRLDRRRLMLGADIVRGLAVGAIAGAVAVGHRGMPRRHISFMYVTWTIATLAVAGYGLARAGWQLMAASFAFNVLETAGTIVWATTKQRMVPIRMLGRVSSLDWFISIGLLPVSFALTGPVAAALGARATLVGAGVLGAAVTLGGLFLPGMLDVERRARSVPVLDAGLTPAAAEHAVAGSGAGR